MYCTERGSLLPGACMQSISVVTDGSGQTFGAMPRQEELVAAGYMKAPSEAVLAEKGKAKGRKAAKRQGGKQLEGFRAFESPSGLQVLSRLLCSLRPFIAASSGLIAAMPAGAGWAKQQAE